MTAHVINRVTILGTGLIGGSFALALRKYTTDMHITGWDRAEVVREAQSLRAIDSGFSGELAPALEDADLIYIALPIGATLDLLPEIVRLAGPTALITDACSTKVRIIAAAVDHVSEDSEKLFLSGDPLRVEKYSGMSVA